MSNGATSCFLVRGVSPNRGQVAYFANLRSSAEAKACELRQQGYIATIEMMPPMLPAGLLNPTEEIPSQNPF
jgi:hypothetical protein